MADTPKRGIYAASSSRPSNQTKLSPAPKSYIDLDLPKIDEHSSQQLTPEQSKVVFEDPSTARVAQIKSFEAFVRDKMQSRFTKDKVARVSRWIRGKVSQRNSLDGDSSTVSKASRFKPLRLQKPVLVDTKLSADLSNHDTASVSFKMSWNTRADRTIQAANKKQTFSYDLSVYHKIYSNVVKSTMDRQTHDANSTCITEAFFHADDRLVFPIRDVRTVEVQKPVDVSVQKPPTIEISAEITSDGGYDEWVATPELLRLFAKYRAEIRREAKRRPKSSGHVNDLAVVNDGLVTESLCDLDSVDAIVKLRLLGSRRLRRRRIAS